MTHGNTYGYRRGCRCSDCKKAKSEQNARRYEGNPPRGPHSYIAAHNKLRKLVPPSPCLHCGDPKTEIALITGQGDLVDGGLYYSLDAADYIRLCRSCHRVYDGHPWVGRQVAYA
jgi:hypothetical protein